MDVDGGVRIDGEAVEASGIKEKYIDLTGYSMIDILDIYYETPERISPEMQGCIMRYLQVKSDARASNYNWMI